eukprot:5546086-Prymnesium_polylepis.1
MDGLGPGPQFESKSPDRVTRPQSTHIPAHPGRTPAGERDPAPRARAPPPARDNNTQINTQKLVGS